MINISRHAEFSVGTHTPIFNLYFNPKSSLCDEDHLRRGPHAGVCCSGCRNTFFETLSSMHFLKICFRDHFCFLDFVFQNSWLFCILCNKFISTLKSQVRCRNTFSHARPDVFFHLISKFYNIPFRFNLDSHNFHVFVITAEYCFILFFIFRLTPEFHLRVPFSGFVKLNPTLRAKNNVFMEKTFISW